MEMEIMAAEDTDRGTDMFPALSPLAVSLYDSFLSTHCSCCFSLLSSAPSQSLYCSAACSLIDSAIVLPQIPPDISPVLPSDIRAALRLLNSISSFSAVVIPLLPHRFGGLLTNHHLLMADSSISFSIRRAAEVLRSQRNKSDSDRKDMELEEAAICCVLTNAVEVQDSTGLALGIAVYDPGFSWINHSCSPNTCYRFVISPPHSTTTSSEGDDDLVIPKTVPRITKTHKEEELGVCSLTSLWEGKTVGYGPKVIARSIKKIKSSEEITVSYIDLLQPTELRQSDLWSKYQFMCSCVRCVASPPAYVDSILEATTEKDEEAVGKMTDDIKAAIDDFLSDNINPETCCEKIEDVMLHGSLHPIHHVSLNAYITLATAYRFRSIDSAVKEAFEMRRISAAYSFFLACVSHHLLSAEPSLAISAASFWKSAGESLLDLSRSMEAFGEESDFKCTKCLSTSNSRQLLRCVIDISQVAWSFLTRGCPYLQKFKSPFDFGPTETNEESKESSEDQSVSVLLLSFHCLHYAVLLTDLCYGHKSPLASPFIA